MSFYFLRGGQLEFMCIRIRKTYADETSMDEITEERGQHLELGKHWELVGNPLGIIRRAEHLDDGAEEHLVATAFWDGILVHLERSEEAFTNRTRISPKSINEA